MVRLNSLLKNYIVRPQFPINHLRAIVTSPANVLIVTLDKSADAYGRICCDLWLFGLLGIPKFSKRSLRSQPLWQSSCTSNRPCIHRYTECDIVDPTRWTLGHI